MKTSGNTILITGGGTGIGLSMARDFMKEGNEVLVCGRRESRLFEAQQRLPNLKVKVCDITDEEERESLADWAIASGVNILVNNAGMQRMVNFTRGLPELAEGDNEIRSNLEAPVYLSARLVPHLMRRKPAAIVNVSSGLGFIPLAIMPVYCATKAALHSFSVSLRHQLSATGVMVFEVIPPMVDTDLDRGARTRRGQEDRGISPDEVSKALLQGMAEDRVEIPVGAAANLVAGSRTNFDQVFQGMNSRR